MFRLLLFVVCFCFFIPSFVFAQTESGDFVEESLVSPEKLEQLQSETDVEQKDSRTLRQLYSNVDFIDVRNMELSVIVDSGFSGEKNNFDSVSGYALGVTWEFPVLHKPLDGGTPILKMRAGKTDIQSSDAIDNATGVELPTAISSIGVSEVYTFSVGGGYCYHIGFNCIYALYNTYLTGQLSTVQEDGTVSTVPTQLSGVTMGMSSTFEVILGIELSVGMEYSILEHVTTIYEPQQMNTLSIVFGVGFVERSRYTNMPNIEFLE